jgi:hypothetical protein
MGRWGEGQSPKLAGSRSYSYPNEKSNKFFGHTGVDVLVISCPAGTKQRPCPFLALEAKKGLMGLQKMTVKPHLWGAVM